MATNGKSVSKSMMRISDIAERLETLAPIDGYDKMQLVSIEVAIVPLTTLVPNVKNDVKEAKKILSQRTLPKGLTIDQAAAIMLYTMEANGDDKSFYKVLNRILRSKNRKELPSWYLYLKLVLTGLSQLQSTRRFIFRGLRSNVHQDYPKDKIVTWWGFSSCAMKIDVLKVFLGPSGPRTMFTIDSNSGKDISSLSQFPDENEVLLLPETQFKVIGSLDNGNELHTIQLVEVASPLSISSPIPKGKFDFNCNGQICDTCGKCHDWRRNGNDWKRFTDATCKHRFDPSNHVNGFCQCN